MPKRIVISGYYGFGNTGDEAVLAGMLATFRQLDIHAEVTVLSADPARTRAEHLGVESVHRYAPLDLLRVIRRADLVVSGGGSLLQDATSARSVHYYLFVLRLAQALRRRTMVYAQGIGPLLREGTRRTVARVLSRADAITVRDDDSKSLLESIGVGVPAQLVADPAFLVEPDLESADELLARHGLDGEDFVVASVRPWSGSETWLPQVAEGLLNASTDLGIRFAVLPMQRSEDTELCERLGAGVVLRDAASVRTAKGVIARSGLVVGMRLHAIIFAASEGVPFVPIVYDPKVASFASAAGLPCSVDVGSVTSESLAQAVRAAWRAKSEMGARLVERVPSLRELALEPGRVVRDMLEHGHV